MIVCMCEGVTDSTVRELVREGASSIHDVSLACSAGSCCRGCWETLHEIMESERNPSCQPRRNLATAS